MRKVQFVNSEYYHIYNRGVDKRVVFQDRYDYERFLYLLFACNDTRPLLNSQHYYRGFASIGKLPDVREKLVDTVCFCFMPNHFHLLLRQRLDRGISLFLQKVGTGYTMYFNTKYNRSGILFQGVFKAIHIDQEEYLTHLTRYIHLNPAELKEPDWKKTGILNWDETYRFIKEYPWSSYSYYLGKRDYARILNSEFLSELFKEPEQYERFVKEWVVENIGFLGDYTIEVSPL